MPRAIDRPSVFWTVRKDHDSLECSVELLCHTACKRTWPSTVALPTTAARQTQDELLGWVAEERVRCEAEGWS